MRKNQQPPPLVSILGATARPLPEGSRPRHCFPFTQEICAERLIAPKGLTVK